MENNNPFKSRTTTTVRGIGGREDLYKVPVPKATNTYCPVSHKDIIESIMSEVDKYGLVVDSEKYIVNASGEKVVGQMSIKSEDNDLGMMMAFKNSYNKSMSLGFAAGGHVFVCSNGMITGNLSLIHKHTWGIKQEIEKTIHQTRSFMEYQFEDLVLQKNSMKWTTRPDKRKTSEIIGRMYMEENLFSANQLGVIKREIDSVFNPDKTEQEVATALSNGHFMGHTMWDFYNNITEGLKTSSSDSYIESHINTHKFFQRELGI